MTFKYISAPALYSALTLAILTGVALFLCRQVGGSKYAQANGNENRVESPENVPTIRTPEQTHELFMTALKNRDADGAVACCVVKTARQIVKEIIAGAEQKGLHETMLGDIGTIASSTVSGTRATYVYESHSGGEETEAGKMVFLKDDKGIWLISSF